MAKTSPLKGTTLLAEDIANGSLYLASDMGRCVNVSEAGMHAGIRTMHAAVSGWRVEPCGRPP